MRYLLLFAIPLLILSCRQTESPKQPAPIEKAASASRLSITAIGDDKLLISYPDGAPQKYTAKGPCSYLLNPDMKRLAIDSSPMSNLGITEIFTTDNTGRFDFSTSRNISTTAWSMAEKEKGIDSDDVLFPRTRALRWAKEGQVLEIQISGETPSGKRIEEILSIPMNTE